jgi:hypothetical protein
MLRPEAFCLILAALMATPLALPYEPPRSNSKQSRHRPRAPKSTDFVRGRARRNCCALPERY